MNNFKIIFRNYIEEVTIRRRRPLPFPLSPQHSYRSPPWPRQNIRTFPRGIRWRPSGTYSRRKQTKKATILKRILSLDPIVSVLREAVEGTSVGTEDYHPAGATGANN